MTDAAREAGQVFDPIRNCWIGAPSLDPLPRNPLVSIIVPSYNQGRYIGETIASILNQSHVNLEIIVVDGASKDETLEVLASYADDPRVRLLSEPDKGVADAVNKGLALARGQICGIQSSDDVYLPGALDAAVRALSASARPGLVYGEIIKVDAERRELAKPKATSYSLQALLSKQTYIPQPAAFFRQALLAKVGVWNSDYFNCDTEFWLRLLWHAPVSKVESAWSFRRMHGEQRDNQRARIAESYSRMIDNSPQVQALPRRLRRAAEAGKFLHRLRYNTESSQRSERRLLWQAVFAYPWLLVSLENRYRLIPWGAEFLRYAGRVRRLIRPDTA